MNTKKWIIAALFAALTCICTTVIKLPTPTSGYIHLGDGMVLLCGILLGPSMGALAAGIGSMLSDLFGGYLIWAPATFLIKALTAWTAGHSFQIGSRQNNTKKPPTTFRIIVSGLISETLMIFGYFLFEVVLNAAANGSFTSAALTSSIAYSIAGIPANIIQGAAGIASAYALLPILGNAADVSKP